MRSSQPPPVQHPTKNLQIFIILRKDLQHNMHALLILIHFFSLCFTYNSLFLYFYPAVVMSKKNEELRMREMKLFHFGKKNHRDFFLRYSMHVMLCSESFVLLPFVNCICSFNNNNNSYIYPIDVCAHNCYDADENIVF